MPVNKPIAPHLTDEDKAILQRLANDRRFGDVLESFVMVIAVWRARGITPKEIAQLVGLSMKFYDVEVWPNV